MCVCGGGGVCVCCVCVCVKAEIIRSDSESRVLTDGEVVNRLKPFVCEL